MGDLGSKTLLDALRKRDFVLTAELSLDPGSDVEEITEQAKLLRPHFDAIQVTENQYGALHMSPLAAASILLTEGVDPILQISVCNRNRAALIGDLLGARALGIRNVQLVQGKKMPDSYQPQPTQVKDISVEELIATTKLINEDPELSGSVDFLIGAVVRARMLKQDEKMPMVVGKVDAGAQLLQTQVCFDLDVLRKYVAKIVSLKLIQRCSVIADIAVFESAESARWLRDNLPHISVPNTIIRRLERADNPEQEGVDICVEYLRELAEIPGLSGANLISIGSPAMKVKAIVSSGVRGE